METLGTENETHNLDFIRRAADREGYAEYAYMTAVRFRKSSEKPL
jgi:hypothetical protein